MKRILAIIVAITMVMTLGPVAYAEGTTKKIVIESEEAGGIAEVQISNFISEEKLGGEGYSLPLYVVESPAKITINSRVYAQWIKYISGYDFATKEAPDYNATDELVKFDVQKCLSTRLVNGEWVEKELDAAETQGEDVAYLPGNYVTLTKPGLYRLELSPEWSWLSTTYIRVMPASSKAVDTTKVDMTKPLTKATLAEDLLKYTGKTAEVLKDKVKYEKFVTQKDVKENKAIIGYCLSKGWLTAKSKTELGVSEKITVDTAVKTILKALGKSATTANIKTTKGKASNTVTRGQFKEMFDRAAKIKK